MRRPHNNVALPALCAFSVIAFVTIGCGTTSPSTSPTASGAAATSPTECDNPNAPHASPSPDPVAPVLAYTITTAQGYTTWTVRADGTERRQIADNTIHASWSPDGRTLVSQEAHPSGALVITDVASGAQHRIDAHLEQARSLDLTWDPTSKRFAFSRLRPGDDTYRDLWISDTSGNAKDTVEYADPIEWSSDGRWIAFRAESPPPDRTSFSPPPQLPNGPKPGTLGGLLQLLDVNSGAIRQISADGFIPYGVGMKVWSPDSHFIAYWRSYPDKTDAPGGDLYASDIYTGHEFPIGTFNFTTFPIWSAIGQRDVIHNVAIDPTTDNQSTLFPKPTVVLAWSADAALAAVVENSPEGGRDIAVRDITAGTRRLIEHSTAAITADLEPGYHAALSPDGHYLAYYGITQEHSLDGDRFPNEDVPITVVNLVSGTSTVVEHSVRFRPGILAFSPDGLWLSVQSNWICVSRADGSNPNPVANGITLGTYNFSDPWRPHSP